jgi:hypothetical protein
MSGTDLILSGTAIIGGVDCSAEVTLATIKGTVNDVVIPATMAADTSHAGGAQKYEIQIDYLSDDASTGLLFPVLWAALGSATKEVTYSIRLHPGAIGVDNPQYDGSFVVSAADVGGKEEELSTGSATFTCTAAPVKTTA